jgi:cytochrome c peroxidase
LGGQVRLSLETTLHATDITPEQVNDLTTFLHTLPPPPPLLPSTDDQADVAQRARGKAVFDRQGCAKCHVPPLTFTSPETYDVGLEDEVGNRKFNPPSLRGVSQNYRFFHDGGAHSLEAVVTEHAHMLKSALTEAEVRDLVRYLKSL